MNIDELSAKLYTDFRKVPLSALLMFYGDNGSGKSKIALEIAERITPRDKKIVYVDTSQGFSCLQSHPELADRLDGRLFILPFDGESQLLTLADAIKNDVAGYGSVGCVILDESSSMAQSVLDTVVYGRAMKDPTKEENKADWPDFNIAGNKWRRVHQNFQSIYGCHFINVAHERTDKVKGIEKLSPAFQPHVGNETRKELQLIAHCEVKEYDGKPVRQVQVLNNQFARAKSRIAGIQEEIYYLPEDVVAAVEAYFKRGTLAKDNTPEEITITEKVEYPDTEPIEV